MTPEQALKILADLTAQISLKRADHQAVEKALQVLSEAIKPALKEIGPRNV